MSKDLVHRCAGCPCFEKNQDSAPSVPADPDVGKQKKME
jgi:hypothetical protein